ncbi:hypothetical protein FRC02_009321 [Tulasnella sp. 418]|nr:hypothetical protein FRC02_009321 [Tulasnella sp. 418]
MAVEASSSNGVVAELEKELLKIRPHVNSGLAHQKTPANLLIALEATFAEQGTQQSPVAYFAALVTTLEQTIQKESPKPSIEDSAILPAVLYLLALVIPFVPSTVLRSNLSTLLPVVAPLFPVVHDQAPPLRSLIGVYASLIPSLDAARLSTPQLPQSYASVLELTMDPRPKVRKKAQETVSKILGSPPPPTTKHPYLEQSADYIMGILKAVEKGTVHGKSHDSSAEVGIWCCTLIKSIAGLWPESHLSDLVNSVLRLPRLFSPFLTSQSFELLSALLVTPTFGSASSHLPIILSTLMSSPPSPSAPVVAQSWLEAVENTMVAFARADPQARSEQLPNTWKVIWNWLKVEDAATRAATEKCLVALARYCIAPANIEQGVDAARSGDQKKYDKAVLGGIINLCTTSMQALPYAHSISSLLRVLTSLMSRLRYRPQPSNTANEGRHPSAAEVLLPELVQLVGQLRAEKHFEHRDRADEVLGMAIEVMGPKAFLQLLPLKILPSELDGPKDEGRAFLLPLLGNRITNTTLGHFVQYFVPLSEKLFDLHSTAEENNKMVEAKIWEACIDQVWACLKGYCEAPTDLTTAFTTPFAQLLTRLLYSHPSLRPPILRAFQALLRSTTSLASSATPSAEMSQSFGIDKAQAQKHLAFIKSIAGNMLSVLFNVFGSVPSDGRGMVGDVISGWLSIAEPKEIEATYTKVITLLKKNASTLTPTSTPVVHTMLDLLILLVPNLTPLTASALCALTLDDNSNLLNSTDATIQKKAYRITSRLFEDRKVELSTEDVEALVTRLENNTTSVTSGSKRDRLHLLASAVDLLPETSLHHISLLLPEAILGTKEVGEKARHEAFDLLVCMGKKMQKGGIVRRAEIDGMEEDDTQAEANIEEFLTMMAAGLAGASPHMISATITSISRVLFEFKDAISEKMQSEVTSTIITFIRSNNREIVKSALGFVKVVIVSLPTSVTKPHLGELVPALLGWSHDHKNHFKSKVRHIFERMIRRFGWDVIWNAARDDDNGKFLLNLKKRKDRSNRKKAEKKDEHTDDDSDQEKDIHKSTSGNAFHDVLYGSESEDSDDEAQNTKQASNTTRPVKGKPKGEGARLRHDDDEPLDMLQGMSSHITTTNARKRRQPGEEADKFKNDEGTGRMIIDDETTAQETKDSNKRSQGDNVSARAYYEQMTSVDGFTRTATGAVKFHKDTKKRRAMEELDDDDDVEMADGTATKPHHPKKKKSIKLGQESKAKVSAHASGSGHPWLNSLTFDRRLVAI